MQYCHKTYLGNLGVSPFEIYNFLEKEGFRSIYRTLISNYYRSLGEEDPTTNFSKKGRENYIKKKEVRMRGWYLRGRESLAVGDLFINEKYPKTFFCLFEYISGDNNALNLWISSWNKETKEKFSEGFEKFSLKCEEFLKSIGINPKFDSYNMSQTNEKNMGKFKDYKLENHKFKNKKEIFDILAKKEYRDILIDIKEKGNKIIDSSIERETKEKIDFLEAKELIEKNNIIICNETKKWWNIALKEEKNLEELKKIGISCIHCGKTIEHEKICKLYNLKEISKNLLDNSRWMVGHIVEKLINLGFEDSFIFVNVLYSGEETDILAFHLGKIFIFELKSKEFSMGDYYKFSGRVARIKTRAKDSTIPIIITTESINQDVKTTIKELQKDKEFDDEEETIENDWILIENNKDLEKNISQKIDKVITKLIEDRVRRAKHNFPYNLLAKEDV